jgi:RND family efflux transporter MFP subunit
MTYHKDTKSTKKASSGNEVLPLCPSCLCGDSSFWGDSMKRMMASGMVVALAALAACGPTVEKREAGPKVGVTTVAVAEQTLPSAEAFVGNIRSRQAVVISTKFMGRVTRFFVEEGQAVTKGQPLVEVDASEAQSAYSQSKAGLDAADVAVRNMELDRERYQKLYEQRAVTQHQLEQVEMGLAAAKAQKAQADANLKASGTLLSYGKILAPDAGIITKKWMDAGNMAFPGAPLLTLENPKDLEISVSVAEDKARAIAPGQQAQLTVDSLGKTLTVPVTTVVAAADPMTRTSTVRLSVPEGSGLAPGQFGSVRFDALALKALAVPASAVRSEGQMDGIFVAENGFARMRWVQLGVRGDVMVQVLSGLKAGDRVIVPVPAGLSDGQPVEASSHD